MLIKREMFIKTWTITFFNPSIAESTLDKKHKDAKTLEKPP